MTLEAKPLPYLLLLRQLRRDEKPFPNHQPVYTCFFTVLDQVGSAIDEAFPLEVERRITQNTHARFFLEGIEETKERFILTFVDRLKSCAAVHMSDSW